jgi:hypothetical protein
MDDINPPFYDFNAEGLPKIPGIMGFRGCFPITWRTVIEKGKPSPDV